MLEMRLKNLKNPTEIFRNTKADLKKIMQNRIQMSKKCQYFINSYYVNSSKVDKAKNTAEFDDEYSVNAFIYLF